MAGSSLKCAKSFLPIEKVVVYVYSSSVKDSLDWIAFNRQLL